jgi:hypothetical protein
LFLLSFNQLTLYYLTISISLITIPNSQPVTFHSITSLYLSLFLILLSIFYSNRNLPIPTLIYSLFFIFLLTPSIFLLLSKSKKIPLIHLSFFLHLIYLFLYSTLIILSQFISLSSLTPILTLINYSILLNQQPSFYNFIFPHSIIHVLFSSNLSLSLNSNHPYFYYHPITNFSH